MRCELVTLSGDPAAFAWSLRELVATSPSVSETVGEIIAAVRAQGDDAVLAYTRQLDTAGVDPAPLRVDSVELNAAAERLPQPVQTALEEAIENVRRVAEAGLGADRDVDFGSHRVLLREAPVERAAIYVPGGRAPYPSTVVMGVVTAQVAGVQEVAVCAPPGGDGEVDPVILGACGLTGATVVYRMGGAQAIAALAYGTESVGAVDVIAGPGNAYVQEAKRQVFGQVGIDGFAGPSDLLLIADPELDPEPLELDLLAQAEHGEGTLVIAISTSRVLLEEIRERILAAPESGAVARLVQVDNIEQALSFAQAFAPEHLELIGREAEELASRATRSGCVLVGAGGGSAFGDYIAGSNHILPTGAAARFASGLGPSSFRRRFAEVRIGDGASELARVAAPLARAEGFELHARSMEARIRDNGQP